jgi:hypothetical protein
MEERSLYKFYTIVSIGDRIICQGDKQMLMKTLLDTYRDVTRQLVRSEPVTTVPVTHSAANASRWIESTSQARRMRRQRRLERAESRIIGGWSVRTW